MAQLNLFFACIFMALIFSQEFQSIDGRHLKIERKLEFPKLKTTKNFEKEPRYPVGHNVHLNNASNGEVFTTNNNISPPAPPATGAVVGELQSPPPAPGHVDDFRPTAPGHSPGVGHSIQN